MNDARSTISASPFATSSPKPWLIEKPDEFFKNTYIYDVKFDAPFSATPKAAGPEALKGTQLPPGGGDPGKAYMAYTKVLAAGDLKALRPRQQPRRSRLQED